MILANPTNSGSEAQPAQVAFCRDFCSDRDVPRFVIGRGAYIDTITDTWKITGVIDDFTSEKMAHGVPVFRLDAVPADALVLNLATAQPLTIRQKLEAAGLRNLDYFAFRRLAGLSLDPVPWNEGFVEEFDSNQAEYEWLYGLLADDASRQVLKQLVNFRYSYDLAFLDGFTMRPAGQYFEDFMPIKDQGGVFFDVGAYDGFTSQQYIERYPNYQAIHLFEPEADNLVTAKQSLAGARDLTWHEHGLSDQDARLRFSVDGSASIISDEGDSWIDVKRLDGITDDAPSFIKMDIEGGEIAALTGGQETIGRHKPCLAIAAYHGPGQFWQLPKLILSIHPDYQVYMRHYTECINETVLYFAPKGT